MRMRWDFRRRPKLATPLTMCDGRAVNFFEAVAASDAEPPPERARPVWLQQEGVIPSIVGVAQILARTEEAAVAVSGIWCYPNGFEFGIEVMLRTPDRRGRLMSLLHSHMLEPGEPLPAQFLRLGVQFADGSKVTNLPGRPFPWREEAPSGPIMFGGSGGGGGGDRRYHFQQWIWPLPPPGPVTFVCEWPHFRISQAETTIDAQLILDAAARAVPLWPEP